MESRPKEREADIFGLIFQASPLAILVADDQGTYVDVNPTACEIFGRSREEMIGKSLYDFVDPAELAPTRASWSDFREQKRQTGDFLLLRPDGSRRLLHYRAVADFAPGLHVSFLDDITDARAAERVRSASHHAFERSEHRFRSLADGLRLIIWVGDSEGRTEYFNRYWYEYTGLTPLSDGSSEGGRMVQVIHPDDFARVDWLVQEHRARGEQIDLTYRIRRHDGVYRWHLARSAPIRDQRGNIVRRLGSATDIEDQKRAIESLQQERDLRERFVAALTHDLRSPLSAAKIGAQLILRRADRPDLCQTQATRIVRNVSRADELIQNLLDVSRISAGERISIDRAPCDVTALVRDVLADQITIYGDRFELDVPEGIHGLCDQAAVRRTLENLIGNAIKYGSPHAPVRVKAAEVGGEISLSVHNDGNPIAREDHARIFQPYHRAGAESRPRAKGWGLGLTLVRGMAEAHGGAVRVESTAESGTTFTVTLRRE